MNHETDKIDYLIKLIIKYAQKNNYKRIRGPINIPVVIFGWGFMKKNSLNTLFACKPVNPPIYQELFFKNNFKVLHEDLTWEARPVPIIDPWKLKNYDFSEYEYFNPKDMDDFMKMKPEFLGLVSKNLPSSAQITPSVAGVYDNYIDYIFNYGDNFLIFFVRYKPSGKLVACGNYLPNPFSKNSKGNYDSFIIHTWVVDPNHRRKGLIFLIYGATSLLLKEKNINYGCGTISGDNLASNKAAKALGGGISRTHLILEYNLGDNEK